MAWERRGAGGQHYLYRSRRVGPRIVHEYIGRGDEADRVAREIAAAKAARRAERAVILAEEVRTCEVRRLMLSLHDSSDTLLEATLLSEGFRRTNYGAWRRRRATRTD